MNVDDPDRRHGFRFIPTLSWDSVAALLALAISGFLYVQTIKTEQAVQAKDIQALQKSVDRVEKSVDRVETDMRERQRSAENQQEKRAERLEAIVRDNSKALQDALQQLRR